MELRYNMAKSFLCSSGGEKECCKLGDKVENVPQGSQSLSALFACPRLSSPPWAALQLLPACVSFIEYLFANIYFYYSWHQEHNSKKKNKTKQKKKPAKIPALVELHSNIQDTRDVSQ